jgi:hypothetical protein
MKPVRKIDKGFHNRSAENDHHQAEVGENQYGLESLFLHSSSPQVKRAKTTGNPTIRQDCRLQSGKPSNALIYVRDKS